MNAQRILTLSSRHNLISFCGGELALPDVPADAATRGDGGSSTSYSYDALGNVLQETTTQSTLSGTPLTISQTYDVAGRRTLLAVMVGSTWDLGNSYSYDNLNRATQMLQGSLYSGGVLIGNVVASKEADYTYNALGQAATLSRSSPWGSVAAVSSYGYDLDNRLTALGNALGSGGLVHRDYSFALDLAGRITQMVSPDGTNNYTYDADNQLLTGSLTSETYTYDLNGNRKTANGSTYQAPAADNQLSNDATYTYGYIVAQHTVGQDLTTTLPDKTDGGHDNKK